MVKLLEESQTVTGHSTSTDFKTQLARREATTRRTSRFLTRLGWFVGRIKLLTGIAALGTAGAILAISGGSRAADRNPEVAVRLVPLIMAAFTMLFLTNQQDRTNFRREQSFNHQDLE